MTKLFGYIPDEYYTEQLIARLPVPHIPIRMVAAERRAEKDALLWKAKNRAQPNWKRGQQAIGDCVSWGAELACTCLMWNTGFVGEAATETIYGGCRVEVHGGPQMRLNEDGAAGSWAADWVKQYGVLLRNDYSKITGNPAHDLRKYSGDKAKQFGYYGCGGKEDAGKLDTLAREHPVQDVAQVRDVDEAAAALIHGCTITVASSVGYEGDKNSEGIIRRRGSWPHQMCVLGVKYTSGGNRLFRQFNSWAASVKGPDPDMDDDERARECSWWTTEDDLQKQLNDQDSFAFSNVKGFTQPAYNFDEDLFV